LADRIDLTKRAWTRTIGELTLIGTWLYQSEHMRWRPCLVLMRSGDEKSDHCIPCVVPLDNAWIWDERIGDPRTAVRTVHEFLAMLRLTQDPRNNIRIASLIHDHLDDLIAIPPYPYGEGALLGELTMTDSNGRVVERELRDV
jgi:hypothetical protein